MSDSTQKQTIALDIDWLEHDDTKRLFPGQIPGGYTAYVRAKDGCGLLSLVPVYPTAEGKWQVMDWDAVSLEGEVFDTREAAAIAGAGLGRGANHMYQPPVLEGEQRDLKP